MSVKDFFRDCKKGSLSTRQIILLIILIAGFLVVLFFLFQLNLGEESKEQICRNSVMQANTVTSVSQNSLQCKTKYVCLTADGTCDEMASPDETIEVSSLGEIYEQLSEQKATCWWMFGSGKVDYVGKDVTKGNYCSICHQTHFDDSLNSIENVENSISKDELYEYMTEHNYSDKQTYSQYILGTNDLESFKEGVRQSENYSTSEVTFGEINVGNTYFNAMGIVSETYSVWQAAAGGGSIAFSGQQIGDAFGIVQRVSSTLGRSVPLVSTVIVVGSAAASAGTVAITSQFEPEIGAVVVEGRGVDNKFMVPTFQEANSNKFKALNCESLVTSSS